MQQVMHGLLEGLPGDQRQQEVARTIASLPMRMGGLGIRSATRMAPAAYWASWADALPMLETRLPQVAQIVTRQLDNAQAPGCLGELQRATVGCVREPDQHQSLHLSLANGSTAGSTTRPPPLNSTFGRPWCLPSLLPLTRLICDRTQAEERARSCA